MKYIYTALFNDYDELREQPHYPGWKYVCFSDREHQSDTWEVRVIENYTKVFRHVKTCPHLFLPEASESIWVDASIRMDRITHLFQGDLCLMEHPFRSTLDEEVEACAYRLKDSEEVMRQQAQRYYQEGYDGKGMVATGIIYRLHNSTNASIGEAWWDEVKRGSVRDQLSFNYVMWKLKKSYNTIKFLEGADLSPHKKKA
jgi:hypothetical protein